MSEHWLLVASRPAAAHTADIWADAATLARNGDRVTVVATDDRCTEAVLALADSAPSGVRSAVQAGVAVVVDGFAARRRNLDGPLSRLPAAASATDADIAGLLVDPGTRTVWR